VKVRYLKLISIRLLNSKLKFTARNFLNLKVDLTAHGIVASDKKLVVKIIL
jgi:hypothetical protein